MRQTLAAIFAADGRVARLLPFVVTLLLIVLNGMLTLTYLHGAREADLRADHALQIGLVLKQINDLVAASEGEQRDYRLSGNPGSLAASRRVQSDLAAPVERLRILVLHDDGQSRRFAVLTRLIERDAAELAADLSPIEAHFDAGRLPPALAASIARRAAISAAVDSMLEYEQGGLRRDLSATASFTTVALGTGTLVRTVAILLVLTAYIFVRGTTRKANEVAKLQLAALRESEHRFTRVFDQSPLGILLAEQETLRIVQPNPAFCRMIGISAEHLVGRVMTELIHVDDRGVLTQATRKATSPSLDVEVRYITRSGAITWAGVRLTRLSGSARGPGLLLVLTEDVTREKRVEAELRQAQKMEAVGQLTGGIAHDFNNLLGVIIGNVEFVIDSARDEDQANLAREILRSALSGADLTRRLLAFARRQTLQPRRIDLNAYLPNHVAILRRLLGESITVSMTLAPDLWPTRADPSQVGDALINLAINARDALPHGGAISIATANARLEADDADTEVSAGDYVVLAVTDSGIGMAPEVLERAVEPFFTTKAPGLGSGLGLSMIFGFAKQSGGHLRIDSEPGRGTTVQLYLPRAQPADMADTDEVAAPVPQGHEAILLVDDNADMRSVARRHLVSLGYRVSEAGNGPAALDMLQGGNRFDLLFTDVVMPDGMTGHQLAAAALELRPELKVLFSTGFSRAEPDGEPAGETLRKPYRRHELAATVRAALEA